MSLLQLLRLGGKIGVIGRYASQFLMRNKEFHDKEFLIRKTKNRLVLKKVFSKLKLNCWRKIIAKFKIRKILMYKNAKKNYRGCQKLCTFFVHFLDELDKNIGQEIPRIFLDPRQRRSFFSWLLTRNLKPRKMGCVLVGDTQSAKPRYFLIHHLNQISKTNTCHV